MSIRGSIWGKLIGGAAGFALGGPIGGLLGTLAGHAVDTYKTDSRKQLSKRQVGFTIALVALCAKMAKADGTVTRDEILAFRQKVDIAPKDMDNVGRLWDLARQTPDGFDGYARQLSDMFPKQSPIFDRLIELLFFIARADGEITELEKDYIRHVSRILGFSEAEFDHSIIVHGGGDVSPYHILGVSPDADDSDIRKAWMALARQHHPDRLIAEALPEEFIRAATERLATINAAYDSIGRMREKK